jgi:hypothetical protein
MYVHVKGMDNIVADALSRMDADFDAPIPAVNNPIKMANKFSKEKDKSFPMSPKLITKDQKSDKTLAKRAASNPTINYDVQVVENAELLTLNGKIYIPNQLQRRVVAWYHEYLAHPGQTQLEATIRQVYYTWPSLVRTHVNEHCRTCDKCQLNKKQRDKK